MNQKENIFHFNHIDKNKSKEEVQEIKELYKYYRYKFWCYQRAYKYFKKLNLAINMSSTGLIVIETVASGLTAKSSHSGSISGIGLALKTFSETKDYKRKIEISQFAFNTYSKVLLGLRTFLRGGTFNNDDFLKEMTVLDETIVDFAPLITRFKNQYGKKFLSRPTETV